MRTKFILFIFLFITVAYITHAQKWLSASAITSPDAVYNQAIATAGNGNVYVTGSFFNQATFGATILTSQGINDGFIAKYNTNGSLLWVKQIGSHGADDVKSIKVLPNGDLVVAGFFEGSVDFAGNNIFALNRNAFVAKFDANGVMTWVRNVSAPFGSGEASAATVDQAGNVYMTGHFVGQLDFGTTVLTTQGINMFVAKYNATGVLQWVKQGGGDDQSASFYTGDKGQAIAVDAAGTSVFVTGAFNDTATFGLHQLITDVNYRGEDVFLVKYDAATGNELWARQGGGIGSADVRAGAHSLDEGRALAVDAAGNCYLAGVFDTVSVFSGTTLTSSGFADVFIAKYSSAGNLEWIRQAGGKSYDFLNAIVIDNGGNIYIAGSFSEEATFGSVKVNSSLFSQAFVAKYTNAGNVVWVQTAGGNNNDAATGLFVDNGIYPNLYVAGTFMDTAKFGDTELRSNSTLVQGFFSVLETIPTSIAEHPGLQNNVMIYPNPVDDQLFIKTEASNLNNHVVVYDITGKILYSNDFRKNEFSIDTRSLPAGMLMVEVNGIVHKVAHR